ncbi:MAG: thioredoxin domain-containing protein [Alphaproteobacteria bacterium]
MAEDNQVKPAGKKTGLVIFVAVALVALLALGVMQFTKKDDGAPVAEQTAEPTDETTTDETTTAETARIDINAALSDRILGDPNAKVKISEHASFTCGHCGDFHNTTFAQVKKEYIDTGKAYLVFSDFPLNAPAVQASMVARCLPQDKYFDFVSLLFEKQKEWAYDPNYLEFLKTEAGKAGLDEAHFQACIQNTELQEGIVNRMKGVQAQWNITSTPSFVINNRNTISGAYPYEEFKKILDEELANTNAPAPAVTEAPPPAPSAEEIEASPEDEVPPEPDAAPETETTPTPATTEPEESGATKAE